MVMNSISSTAAQMAFLQRVRNATVCDKVRSCKIRKSLNVEPILLLIERSQLHWFGHVSRMSKGVRKRGLVKTLLQLDILQNL